MPKLVVNIGLMPRQLTLSQFEAACSLAEELQFSSHVGQEVSLAHAVNEGRYLVIFATAMLDRFLSTNTESRALFTNLVVVTDEIKLPNRFPGSVFSIVEESSLVPEPNRDLRREGNQEAGFVMPQPAAIDVYGQIGKQVRNTAKGVCAFSGVTVFPSDGAATPIRPADTGGEIHVRNFIFLHDEPAQLFNRFAWTVGPDFEIIVDGWSMGTNVLSTVNPSGKLLVGDDQRNWPDETALAWHRQKFLGRLR